MEVVKYSDSDIIMLVVTRMLNGDPKSKIKEVLQIANENYTEIDLDNIIAEALKVLEESVSTDVKQITAVHTLKYEAIVAYANMVGSNELLLKAMRQKENVAGLSRSVNKISIKKETNIRFGKDYVYDENLLTDHQKARLEYLKKKASIMPSQLQEAGQNSVIVSNATEDSTKNSPS
jgi:hypothetical protein